MLHFGAFITESSGHLSEYLPYYRTDADTMARYLGPEYDGESSFYSTQLAAVAGERRRAARPDAGGGGVGAGEAVVGVRVVDHRGP